MKAQGRTGTVGRFAREHSLEQIVNNEDAGDRHVTYFAQLAATIKLLPTSNFVDEQKLPENQTEKPGM